MPTRKNALRSITSVLVVLLLSVWATGAHAGVNPRNGDFYLTYEDAKLNGKGHELSMDRTYNSKAVTVGWFGYGWGSAFETRLTVMPDQTAVIAEIGSGADSFFHNESIEREAKQVAAGVARIVAAATLQDKLSPDAADALAGKLMGSEEERFSAVTKYGVHSELPHKRKLKLTAFGSGYCAGTLQRTGSGYRRDDGCGKVEDFDLRGNLIRRAVGGGYQITFRIENDRPVEIRDSDGQRIHLSWTQDGQVNRLSASNGVVVEYEYDDNHNLISVNSLNGNTYRHDYDRNHNMTRIRYMDDSAMTMTYTAGGLTTSVTERSGERTLYEYSTSPDNPNQYSTRIRKIAKDGSEMGKMLAYQDSQSATGERNLQGYSVADQGGESTTELDEKKRVKRKTFSSGGFIAYTYHPILGKVATVNLDDKLTAHYEYNAAGELTHVEDSLGQAVDIEYDGKNRINHLASTGGDGSHSDLRIKHNAQGLPIELTLADVGTVTVQYDVKGEISNVESDGGSIVARSIMETFQILLKIVKLAEM